MAEQVLLRGPAEILIAPAEKQHRGPQTLHHAQAPKDKSNSQQFFRGSRFRGISKNGGSSW